MYPKERRRIMLSVLVGLIVGNVQDYTWKGSAAVGLGLYLFLDTYYPCELTDEFKMPGYSDSLNTGTDVIPFSF